MTTGTPAAPAASAMPAPAAGGTQAPGGAPDPTKGDTPATPAPETGGKRKKYVVDGAEHEIDLLDEKAIDVLIQKGLGADKRFKEASRYREQAEMLTDLAQNKPLELLKKAAELGGWDLRKRVEDWLYDNYVKPEGMTPEEKKAYETTKELETLREKDKEREKLAEQQKFEKAKAASRANFERDIMGALDEGGLPKTPRTVQRMAAYLYEGLKSGVRLAAKDVLPLVRADYESDIKALFGPMPADVLAKLVGDENLKKLREYDLNRIKGQNLQPGAPPAPPNNNEGPAPTEKKRFTPAEWKADLDKKFGK